MFVKILALVFFATTVLAGDDAKFSIGLGVLAPSYSQKFGDSGSLDVNQEKNGFSYTLNNQGHPGSRSSVSHSQGPASAPVNFPLQIYK